MDAHRLTLACATHAEERAARRTGLPAAVIGLAGVNGLPQGDLVSFGLAGALDGCPTGTVIDATRVVDERGNVLWTGEPLGIPGAVRGTVLAADRVIDDPDERRLLYERTGADAVDLESGALARSGQLRGVVRAVSDTPDRTLHGICAAVRPDGRYDWSGLAKAFARAPRGFSQAASDAHHALAELTRTVSGWQA